MRPIDDSLLTPDERLTEVASILAAGVLRLCARTLPAKDASQLSAPENSVESASSRLEVHSETVRSVHNG